MPDEWSKPVKGKDGRWESESLADQSRAIDLNEQGTVRIFADYDDACYAPRDVVLRLLAAEASDRLGWVWEVRVFDEAYEDDEEWSEDERGEAVTTDAWRGRWAEDCGTLVWHPMSGRHGFTSDAVLAAYHGKFLLEDALREAGR